jgi:hypothetical protein
MYVLYVRIGSGRNWGHKADAAKQLRKELLQMEEEVRAGGMQRRRTAQDSAGQIMQQR